MSGICVFLELILKNSDLTSSKSLEDREVPVQEFLEFKLI